MYAALADSQTDVGFFSMFGRGSYPIACVCFFFPLTELCLLRPKRWNHILWTTQCKSIPSFQWEADDNLNNTGNVWGKRFSIPPRNGRMSFMQRKEHLLGWAGLSIDLPKFPQTHSQNPVANLHRQSGSCWNCQEVFPQLTWDRKGGRGERLLIISPHQIFLVCHMLYSCPSLRRFEFLFSQNSNEWMVNSSVPW